MNDLYLIFYQEVIGALVTHIGSGFALEIDAAFTVAQSLTEEVPKKVVPFTIFFKVCKQKLFHLMKLCNYGTPYLEGIRRELE